MKMERFRHRLAAVMIGCTAILFLGSGCSAEKFPRYRVSGKATWAGQPIPAGMVYFEPDFSQGNKGPAGRATIKDGVYDTAAAGKGVVCGPHRVRVDGFDPARSKSDDGIVQTTPLFETYETTLVLPAAPSEVDFDVPASAKTPASSGLRGR
jgi:hypothetical protein